MLACASEKDVPIRKNPDLAGEIESLFGAIDESTFRDPLGAFNLLWTSNHNHGLDDDLILRNARIFAGILESQCERSDWVPWPEPSATGDLSPLFGFFSVIDALLEEWRNDAPKGDFYGSIGSRWLETHPDTLRRIQSAQRARTRHCVLAERSWSTAEVIAAPEEQNRKKVVVVWEDRLNGQRTWAQAARTFAYALFGDFLAGDPEQIGFCQRCQRPFHRGKKILFCSAGCARAESATFSRHEATVNKRRRGLQSASKVLRKWLNKPHRKGSNWRRDTENAFGLRSRDRRHSRLMGEYIMAADTPLNSPKRIKLLDSLLSRSAERAEERANVQQQLEGFLLDIKNAEARRREDE